MTWLDIIKKNNKEFKIEKKEEKQEEIIVVSHYSIYQNVDVEFVVIVPDDLRLIDD